MTNYDLIIRNGLIYDGSGGAPFKGDIAINGDHIEAVGDLSTETAAREIDVNSLAVAPGFINMLSWSVESLIEDGRSQSEIRQGVTLEVMGEGTSMGPMSDSMKAEHTRGILGNARIHYDIEWTTLGEYLEWLEKRGVSTNITSFVGSSTLREHTVGYDDRPPTDDELEQMKTLGRQAMEEGAVGLSAALIYPPASYANIDELIELASVISEYDGLYISHIRGEGNTLPEAAAEFIEIVDFAKVRGEIYHLKAAGAANWHLMDETIQMIEEVRKDEGLPITADMYTYPYSGTGLASCIPPWAHEGGFEKLKERLQDPQTRARIKAEMGVASTEWENMYEANGPDKILLSGFSKDALKPLTGKTLAEVAAMRGTTPEDTVLDLVLEDDSRVFTIYFTMSEDNLRKQVILPWVSFCSDAESQSAEGVFLKTNPHPRAYGSFARLLAKYVRDEKLVPLEEAVRRLTSFPAANLKLEGRGSLQPGFFADVVVFDPDTIQDHATPEKPHVYATGMQHVFVNGVQVLENGEHTGAKPGRFVRGPGWNKKPFEVNYPPALHPLLTLGDEYEGDYAEFNIGKEHAPDLLRMFDDVRLHLYDDQKPQFYAWMHAARRLTQLGAPEAIPHLVDAFTFPVTQEFMMELPIMLATFGEQAIPILKAKLDSGFIWMETQHLGIIVTLRGISENFPHLSRICEGILLQQMEKYLENSIGVNTITANALANMESLTAAPLIKAAYADRAVNEDIIGTWDDMRIRLNLPESESEIQYTRPAFGEYDNEPIVPHSKKASADAKKKKAKRKQADKMKKMQRKKKKR